MYSTTRSVRNRIEQFEEYSSDWALPSASQSVKYKLKRTVVESTEYSYTVQYGSPTHPTFQQQVPPQLERYIADTLTYIKTVTDFCVREPKWTSQRESEIKKMTDIQKRAEGVFGSFRRQKLEKELGEVLNDTLIGLEDLQSFLDAVERLAVTSQSVFMDESFLPNGINSKAVRSVISTASDKSPLLILFKRDAKAFFFPSLDNFDVLVFQLQKYMRIKHWLCKAFVSRNILQFKGIQHTLLKFSVGKRESMENMTDHLSQLSKIRMDESFRLTSLFKGNAEEFIETYSGCKPRMFEFLSSLKETADKLDKMKKGSSISTVAGSSVGAVGGALSITGLALAPVTAGVSLALTLTGLGLGITSGVNSVATGLAEYFVNRHQGKNADRIFQNFMEDVKKVVDCLEQIACSELPVPKLDNGNVIYGAVKAVGAFQTVCKGVDNIVDGAAAVKRLTKVGRVWGVTANALFLGVDLFLICKESVSLAKGKKNHMSRFICSRSALWRSELEAWDKIYHCVKKGEEMYQRNLEILETGINKH